MSKSENYRPWSETIMPKDKLANRLQDCFPAEFRNRVKAEMVADRMRIDVASNVLPRVVVIKAVSAERIDVQAVHPTVFEAIEEALD